MVLTVLEAQVPLGNETALQTVYEAAATATLPAGFVRSELLQDARDPTRWRIQTWWVSLDALDAMRSTGTPRGVLIFHGAGAEPVLSIFNVVRAMTGAPT